MKYTYKALPVAALALAALLFSSVTSAYATGINPVINRAAVKSIKNKLAEQEADQLELLAGGLSGRLQVTGTPPVPTIHVACSYALPQLDVTYSASFLGFTFLSGNTPTSPSHTPYQVCV